MGFLDDIATYLEDTGHGSRGTNMFIGFRPPKPDSAVTLYEYAGIPPQTLVEAERPGLQITVRTTKGTNDYQTGKATTKAITDELHDTKNILINGTRYTHIVARQSPFPMGRDESGRPIFAVNFDVKKDR